MREPIVFRGNYINGEFVLPTQTSESWTNHSPADLSEEVISIHTQNSHVDDAVSAAAQAFVDWSEWSIADRMQALQKVKEEFVRREQEIAVVIARETGKPLWDATTEAKALVGKFDITFQHSMELIHEVNIENALPGVRGVIRHRPRGVFAVLGPFNFPAHLPNGHIVPALVTGNTVVFKPSELTPATGQIMAECYLAAGLPAGVFNLVHGKGEVGKRLVGHQKIDGVLFTGSYETGLKIKEATLGDYWKILALEMGGKNSTLICEDANFEKALYESLIGVYLSSGQRCSCTSRIFVASSLVDRFTEEFYQAAKKLTIGHWSNNPFMGPLISSKALDNYVRFQDVALREGCERIMRGKPLELEHRGHYVTPSIYRVPQFGSQSVYQNTEIFGPNAAIYSMESVEEGVGHANESGYGLAMAVFSESRESYEIAVKQAKVGILNWNRTTNGASSKLPFGGRGKSGNDRPSAHFAVYYTTVPMASLEDPTPFNPQAVLPGMNWSK